MMGWHDLAIRFVSYLPFYLVALVFILAWWQGKLPVVEKWQKFGELLASRGGSIAILTMFSLIGLKATMELFYYTLDQVQRGTLQENNAYALMGLQFVTTSLFSGSMGALLKTMIDSSGIKPEVEPKP